MSANAANHDTSALSSRLTDTLVFNALWFQGLWFCTVLGRDAMLPVAAALLLFHIVFSRDYRDELRQLLVVGGMGVSVDAVLSYTGVFAFSGGALVPLWLCCLWFGFAAALGRSLAWLSRWGILASLVGAIAFPLNYWAGMRLGGVEFGYSLTVTLGVLALTWAVMLPVMFRVTGLLSTDAPETAP